MANKIINTNGYDYVDLGLPSSTLWAACNVGADKPSDSGLYFQWGDTRGYTKEQVGKDKQFTWKSYKWNPSGDGETFIKYNNYGAILEFEDDAAHVHMGGDWHMPNPKQIQELRNNTTSSWITQNGVKGRMFTSNNGKSIFIPAAGTACDNSVDGIGNYGFAWSSMLNIGYVEYAQSLGIMPGGTYLYGSYRRGGRFVRGVIG